MNARILLSISLSAAIVLSAAAASAQVRVEYETPITGGFEVKFGTYVPSIDDEFDGDGPIETFFGGTTGLYPEIEYYRHFYDGVGTAGLGFAIGLMNTSGDAILSDGSDSADNTRMTMVPLRLSGIYRFDYLQDRFGIPFVFNVKLGLDYYFWSVRSAGDIAEFVDDEGSSQRARGGTAGYHMSLGVHFLLDFLAPNMARTFDANAGVNNSYIFFEYLMATVDDFGGSNSWDLSDNTALFGLAFEF